MFFKSLISRIIILNILLLVIGVGSFSLLHLQREQSHLINSTRTDAEVILATIENSIFNSMKAGKSSDVQAILEMVGQSHNIANVRIFHPNGIILKSSRPEEIGTKLEGMEYLLYQNAQQSQVFSNQGEDVLGMVKPIVAEEVCFRCHGHGRKVIGVLNLNFSLAQTEKNLRASSQYYILSAVVITLLLAFGVSFILLRFVKRPIGFLVEKMARVEEGDLSVRMNPRYHDEIGRLMVSFNSMVSNLSSARKEVERLHLNQMERADRLASIGEMATGLAHEIRNPLAGISGAISVLADDFPSEDPRREIVKEVLDQIVRLDKTVHDLLYFGRPGKPEMTLQDMNALIRKTVFFIAQHPAAKKVQVEKELMRELPPVLVDEKQLQQVFLNIFLNAFQEMAGGGILTVQTELANVIDYPFVRILITDSGKGISPEDLDKIFTPFFTTKTQGTGLGLPICRQLIEQQNGRIRVESKVGEGTTFIIELPAVTDFNLSSPEEEPDNEA